LTGIQRIHSKKDSKHIPRRPIYRWYWEEVLAISLEMLIITRFSTTFTGIPSCMQEVD
jgi:hypothetical protein